MRVKVIQHEKLPPLPSRTVSRDEWLAYVHALPASINRSVTGICEPPAELVQDHAGKLLARVIHSQPRVYEIMLPA
jgi:hypothetical protein